MGGRRLSEEDRITIEVLRGYRKRCACALCGKLARKMFLDHDHKTGKIRGIVCPSCNQAAARFQGNLQRLRAV